MTSQWLNARGLSEIYIFTTNLVLTSPAILGSGDKDGFTDISILRDLETDAPLLSGSSLAGIIRNHLQQKGVETDTLFGSNKNKISNQSYVIFDESVAKDLSSIEFRDGVSIRPDNRTANDKFKFDYEIISKGTVFPVEIELLVPYMPENDHLANEVKTAFLICIDSLLNEEIQIGAKTTRGFGFCKFSEWKVRKFQLNSKPCKNLINSEDGNTQTDREKGIISWVKYGTELDDLTLWEELTERKDFERLLCVEFPKNLEEPKTIQLKATFALKSSMLIRSDEGLLPGEEGNPDTAPLKRKSLKNNIVSKEAVISGTSLAGVLRHRARKILIAQNMPKNDADKKIGDLFGQAGDEDEKKAVKKEKQEPKKKSRLIVKECVIENTQDSEYVQSRVAIDRFTAGAAENKLFSEQAIFKVPKQTVQLELIVRNATYNDFDLLLHLLKDLWYGDLPIGSGASIGRGLLQGLSAEVTYNGKTWETNSTVPKETTEVPLVLNLRKD